MGVSASSRIFITLQLSVDALDVSVALISYIPVSLMVCEMRTLAIPEGGNASCV
ncbi:MAG: hypothetical protein ACI90R_002229, partial [Alteromonas macleodii]